jgi:uncharacterized protein YecE (DUF72 family)
MATLYAGTSGFAYPKWKPEFYPADVPAKRFLAHYASRLNAVEINYTYRQLPKASTLEEWVLAVPEDFVFCLKAHMKITHVLRLRNTEEFTSVFFRAIEPLHRAGRLGVVLFQVPPNLSCDAELLRDFLGILPRGVRHAFEFRNKSWFNDGIYDLLQERQACLCLAESEKLKTPPVETTEFLYFRLRKPDYTPEEREGIAAEAGRLLNAGRTVYVFFKHEDSPHGALYAEELLRRVADNRNEKPK